MSHGVANNLIDAEMFPRRLTMNGASSCMPAGPRFFRENLRVRMLLDVLNQLDQRLRVTVIPAIIPAIERIRGRHPRQSQPRIRRSDPPGAIRSELKDAVVGARLSSARVRFRSFTPCCSPLPILGDTRTAHDGPELRLQQAQSVSTGSSRRHRRIDV